jgi:N-acetylglucosaminyldiphosphoundecaprenol N-acetyl-beta-D-mannosaminyltransferase
VADRIHIGNCPIDCLDFSNTVEALLEAIRKTGRLRIAPVNASTVVMAASDTLFRETLEGMDMLLPDGYWLHWAARLLGRQGTNHVATVPLTYALLERLAPSGGTVFLLGAEAAVVEKASLELGRRFPGLRVVGARNGYFLEGEEEAIVDQIMAAHPQVLLLGISSPKRELFVTRHRERLEVPVVMGVGGLLDILGGRTKEGPQWLRNYGLMWLYRFAKEPRRLWKRYTVANGRFALIVLKDVLEGMLERSGKVLRHPWQH